MKTVPNHTRTICVAALATLVFTTVAHAQSAPMAMPMKTEASADVHHAMMGSDSMRKSMMAGMESMQKMPMTGNTDKDFALMMKIHHQQAVDMAQMELKDGKSPAMKKMAKQIISAQKKEIAMFDQWLAKAK